MTYNDLIKFLNSLPKHQLDNPIQIYLEKNDSHFLLDPNSIELTVTNNSDHTDDIPIIIIDDIK